MRKFKWTKNGDGRPDPVLTMTWIGFVVIMVRVLVGGVNVVIAGHTLSVSPVDSGVIAAILTPTLGAYVANRYSTMVNHPYYAKMRQQYNMAAIQPQYPPQQVAPNTGQPSETQSAPPQSPFNAQGT